MIVARHANLFVRKLSLAPVTPICVESKVSFRLSSANVHHFAAACDLSVLRALGIDLGSFSTSRIGARAADRRGCVHLSVERALALLGGMSEP